MNGGGGKNMERGLTPRVHLIVSEESNCWIKRFVCVRVCVCVCACAHMHLQGRGVRKKQRKVASTPTHSLSPNNILLSDI